MSVSSSQAYDAPVPPRGDLDGDRRGLLSVGARIGVLTFLPLIGLAVIFVLFWISAHQVEAELSQSRIDIRTSLDAKAFRDKLMSAELAIGAFVAKPSATTRAALATTKSAAEQAVDAVASRDHVAEFTFITSMLAVNLSRLSEEVILWTSRQFRWVELDDAYATGSSIMPQKKNSDIAELTRGKAGRLIGNLSGLLATLKSLPLAYNRDLAEDKIAAFDSIDTLELVLPAMAGMIRTMHVNVDEMRRQAPLGFTLATEVADWLALRGVPFSEAHEITGALVRACEQQGIELGEVSVATLAAVDARLEPGVLDHVTLDAAVAARRGYGGTAPARVAEQIARLRSVIEEQVAWAADYKGPSC